MKHEAGVAVICLLFGAFFSVAIAVGVPILHGLGHYAQPVVLSPAPMSDERAQAIWSRFAEDAWPDRPPPWADFSSHAFERPGLTVQLIAMKPGFARTSHAGKATRGRMDVYQVGWPFHSLRGAATTEANRNDWHYDSLQLIDGMAPGYNGWAKGHRIGIPTEPVWSAALGNAMLFGAVLWLAIRGRAAIRRAWRTWRNKCPGCGYASDPKRPCSECGAEPG